MIINPERYPWLVPYCRSQLENSGALGREMLGAIDWSKCKYFIVDFPWLQLTERTNPESHLVPNVKNVEIERTPSASVGLASHLSDVQGSVALFKEFALKRPHRLVSEDEAVMVEEELFYKAEIGVCNSKRLQKMIELATSWMFFGVVLKSNARSSDCFFYEQKAVSSIVLSIFSGDSYLVIALEHGRLG